MAFGALEHADVAEVDRVLEWFISLVTALTFPVSQRTEVHRVLE